MGNVHLSLLGTSPAFCYMFILFLGDYNPYTTSDIKLKFSAFLSCVKVTKCVKFQVPRYTRYKGFKFGIFWISPIGMIGHFHLIYFVHFIE